MIIIDFSFRIYVIYDAVISAKKLKNYELKFYNTWYYYLILTIGIISITWHYDYNSVVGVKSYKIPTSSNEPTFMPGDRVVADLKAFDNTEPNYGDIVIFQKKDSLNPWVYRIVALPNDKLEIKKIFLIINGKKCEISFIQETKSDQFDVFEYEEELPNGYKHQICTFINPYGEDKNVVNEIIIPTNSYYVIGDNRDNAIDLRYIGPIKREEIIAKLVFGFLGKTTDRININF